MRKGTVFLVGAGPGDPGLLTVRGQELLRQAEVVVYDHLVSPRLLDVCPPSARLIYVGKEAEKPSSSQRAINVRLIREARAGKQVIRLKGGDPLLFGRGGEEALALRRAGIPFEIVPGVTSVIAVPAYAGIPLTDRTVSSSVAIVTGHEDPAKPGSRVNWAQLATACDTLVCLMGVSTLPAIAKQLLRAGRAASTPCAVIEWGTYPRQRTLIATLGTIAAKARAASIRPPAIIVIGEVVKLRRHLDWFESRPLFGRRILVTRAIDKAGSLVHQLESLGSTVEQLPAIELASVKSNGVFRDAIRDLPNTDWVFFTSPEGISWFARMLKPYRKDVRLLSGCHIGAIGPKTAEAIEAAGLHVDFVPKQFRQEGILEEFPGRLLSGKRALLLNAEGSREVLEEGLRSRGMRVRRVPVYRTVMPKGLQQGVAKLFDAPFDAVTVTSASCVEHLFQALQAAGKARLFGSLRFVSIGPITSAAVRARGGRVMVEAQPSTAEGLVAALVRRSARRSP